MFNSSNSSEIKSRCFSKFVVLIVALIFVVPCQIIKGIDRRPVSNLDYDEIRKRGDSTDSDEFLIKAAMQAIVGGIKKKPLDKKVIIIIGLIAAAALIFFMTRGGA